ncbi:MAG: CoA pyrophosphatase [Citricoccus sp.]|jgi:8-oxo-dGTP pyrophosphatase MutT (NUDIX family)|nr:CoA pyrophosphatase [Citricoccus sp. WCRC_4]
MMEIDGALADLRALVARYGVLGPGMAPGERPDRLPDDGRGWDFGVDLVPAAGVPAESAVLVLFGALDRRPSHFHTDAVPEDLDLLLTQRALHLRKHPGQVAFPGGRKDPEDADHVATALREAQEETGLDPDGVRVLGSLPPAPLTVTNFRVTPVVGWWDRPSDVFVVDEGEATRVFRVPVADLVDPANRITTSRSAEPSVGVGRFRSPGFLVSDTLVWGFTAIVIDRILELLGWAQDWDRERVIDISGWDASQPVPVHRR